MKIEYKKTFQKQFKKLNTHQQEQFFIRLRDFIENPNSLYLRNHALKGNYSGYRSINITGDLRALFKQEGEILTIFYMIGSHSELY